MTFCVMHVHAISLSWLVDGSSSFFSLLNMTSLALKKGCVLISLFCVIFSISFLSIDLNSSYYSAFMGMQSKPVVLFRFAFHAKNSIVSSVGIMLIGQSVSSGYSVFFSNFCFRYFSINCYLLVSVAAFSVMGSIMSCIMGDGFFILKRVFMCQWRSFIQFFSLNSWMVFMNFIQLCHLCYQTSILFMFMFFFVIFFISMFLQIVSHSLVMYFLDVFLTIWFPLLIFLDKSWIDCIFVFSSGHSYIFFMFSMFYFLLIICSIGFFTGLFKLLSLHFIIWWSDLLNGLIISSSLVSQLVMK